LLRALLAALPVFLIFLLTRPLLVHLRPLRFGVFAFRFAMSLRHVFWG
jgi:hypothetical protein